MEKLKTTDYYEEKNPFDSYTCYVNRFSNKIEKEYKK